MAEQALRAGADSPSAQATYPRRTPPPRGRGTAGQLRDRGELAGGAWAWTRSEAHTPRPAHLGHPGEPVVLPGGGASGHRQARAAGQHVQRHPRPNAAAGLADSPGKVRADAGLTGPRRPVVAALTASSSSAAASRISASSAAMKGS